MWGRFIYLSLQNFKICILLENSTFSKYVYEIEIILLHDYLSMFNEHYSPVFFIVIPTGILIKHSTDGLIQDKTEQLFLSYFLVISKQIFSEETKLFLIVHRYLIK